VLEAAIPAALALPGAVAARLAPTVKVIMIAPAPEEIETLRLALRLGADARTNITFAVQTGTETSGTRLLAGRFFERGGVRLTAEDFLQYGRKYLAEHGVPPRSITLAGCNCAHGAAQPILDAFYEEFGTRYAYAARNNITAKGEIIWEKLIPTQLRGP
jgi:hypothetical protein